MAITLNEMSAGWAVLSGLIVGALGATAMFGGRRKIRGAIPFGLFGMIWGIQIVVINLATVVVSKVAAETLYLASIALLIPLPFLLASFIIEQPVHRRIPVIPRLVRAITGIVAVSATLVFWFEPGLLYKAVTNEGPYSVQWGPLLYVLITIPFYAVFAYGLHVIWKSMQNAPTLRTSRPLRWLTAGLAVYVAFTAAENGAFYTSTVTLEGSLNQLLLTILFDGLILLCLWYGATSLYHSYRAPGSEERKSHAWIATSLLLPLAWGVIEGSLAVKGGLGFRTIGIWRIAAVGLVAYGIAHWRIADLSRRTTRFASTGVGAAGASAGGLAASGVTSLVLASPLAIVLIGALTAGVSLTPMLKWSKRVFGTGTTVPGTKDVDNEVAYGERVEAYRAAVEAAVARDRLDADGDFLGALRESFQISQEEHRLLVHLAKRSVLVLSDDGGKDTLERLRLLGEGGCGRTWLARDRRRDRFVVIKEPLPHWQQDPRLHKAVHDEAKIASKVRHPNVVRTEALIEDKQPLILMEYADGGTLRDLLRARGVIYWKDARDIAIDVLNGLAAVHGHGIVHRDIKPSNIFFDRDGNALIGDFGIARFQENRGTMVEGQQAPEGTKNYMAPETVHTGMSDERADLYGVAAVLHECLYGSPPGQSSVTYAQNDIPDGMLFALRTGLERDPDARHQTATEFAKALGETRS